jgi:hypothetical protein
MAGFPGAVLATIVGLGAVSVGILIAVLMATIGLAVAVRRESRLGTLSGLAPDGLTYLARAAVGFGSPHVWQEFGPDAAPDDGTGREHAITSV